jgi:hypothetical protein
MSLATAVLISCGPGVANSQSRTESDAVRIERLRSEVAKLGTGKKVQIKLLSNQTLIGNVGVIEDDKFGLIESPHRAAIPLRYQDLRSIKKWRSDSWQPLVFGVAVIAGVMGLAVLGLRGE